MVDNGVMDEFEQFAKRMCVGVSSSEELDRYVSEPPEPSATCPLAWWRANWVRFPHLSNMARDVLAIPATSVPCEQMFSSAGRVITDYRAKLSPETVESLMCQRDWLLGAKKYGWQL